jgi:glycosyltransferase involved in cell wall biosynthesis
MKTMTVLIACDTFAPDRNGTATFSKNLAVTLQKRGYEVHVIAPATSKLYGTFREQHDGVPIIVHRLKSYRLPLQPSQRFVSPIRLTNRLNGLLSAVKPEVVHIQSHINIGHHAAIAAVKNQIRLVATSHIDAQSLVENAIAAPKFVKNFLTKLLLKDAARVFRSAESISAPTKRAAQMLEAAVQGLRVLPISGGVDVDLFNTIPEPQQASRTLLYVGRLDREKHVYVLLAALAKVPESFNISLEVVGSGSQSSELVKLAADLGIQGRVHFSGELSDTDLLAKLGESSVFVMPSIQELQSMATLEAMAAGRPIIAANAMALPHLVHDGENGFLFSPDSPSDLACKIQDMFALTSKEFDRLSQGSRVLVESHDLGVTVDVYERLYKGLPVDETTLDNDSEYQAPISTTKRFSNFVRRSSKTIERGTNGVIERLDEARGSVVETFTEVRFSIERRSRKATKKLSNSLRRILNSIRKDD